MPDGFDPHREIARIMTLQELMIECRQRAPKILALADEMLDSTEVSYETKLKVMEFVANRGYGKPRQTVVVTDPEGRLSGPSINPVKVYLPDNHRRSYSGPIVDIDGQENENA